MFSLIGDQDSFYYFTIEETENKNQSSGSNNDEAVETSSRSDLPAEQVNFEYKKYLKIMDKEKKNEVETMSWYELLSVFRMCVSS